MNPSTSTEILKLQTNLQTIRKVAGWTTEELGDRIGVTKQTISNLENKKTDMTKTQYIALRTILDYEIASNPDSVALARVVDVLLNTEETTETEETTQADEGNSKKTKSVETAKAVGKTIATAAVAAAVPLVTSPIAVAATAGWLTKIIKDKK